MGTRPLLHPIRVVTVLVVVPLVWAGEALCSPELWLKPPSRVKSGARVWYAKL